MTIHPIFVHFPIALLTVYSIIEILQFQRIKNSVSLQETKKIVLYIGTIMAFITLLAGGYDADLSNGPASFVPHQVVDIHAAFGVTTFIWFTLIALSYAFRNSMRWPKLANIACYITTGKIIIFAALIGFLLVFFTGALGGAIAYSNTDPVGQLLLSLLGVSH